MDLISRAVAIDALFNNQDDYSNHYGDDPIDKYTVAIIDNDIQTLAQLPSAESELVQKIYEIGYTGKEGRIFIGGRLFAVRELAQ